MTASPTTQGIGTLLAEIDDELTPAGVLDEGAKREIRRAALSAVCVPGYQVPFGSREMPVARGWGSGGLQVTLALVSSDDTVKVIDQGDDGGVNAANLRRLIAGSAGCDQTTDSRSATIVQTRHRVPEQVLGSEHVLVLQVPVPEPLRGVQRSVAECARMHAEADYSAMWVSLYEDLVRNGVISRSTGYPVFVNGRYVMATTPIPRWDVPRLNDSAHLSLFGAGREKRIYAVPPHTDVVPLAFDDVPFESKVVAAPAACGADPTTRSWSTPARTASSAATPNGASGYWPPTPTAPRTATRHPCICCRTPTGESGPDRLRRSRCPLQNSVRCPPGVRSGHSGWSGSVRCTGPVAPRPSPVPVPSTAPRSARRPVRWSPRGTSISTWRPARHSD